ncbi:MAG: hypothetical protein ACR2PA_16935 [Hyphomicrobiaceae bacterium]
MQFWTIEPGSLARLLHLRAAVSLAETRPEAAPKTANPASNDAAGKVPAPVNVRHLPTSASTPAHQAIASAQLRPAAIDPAAARAAAQFTENLAGGAATDRGSDIESPPAVHTSLDNTRPQGLAPFILALLNETLGRRRASSALGAGDKRQLSTAGQDQRWVRLVAWLIAAGLLGKLLLGS